MNDVECQIGCSQPMRWAFLSLVVSTAIREEPHKSAPLAPLHLPRTPLTLLKPLITHPKKATYFPNEVSSRYDGRCRRCRSITSCTLACTLAARALKDRMAEHRKRSFIYKPLLRRHSKAWVCIN